jgi:ubiquinone/menaquinone biosynthesis C-methylase UbiE
VDPSKQWERIYATKKPEEVSWYRPHLETSLRLIAEAAPDRNSRIIDVGGGESTLVDDLVRQGYGKVSVLDLSETALSVARKRMGSDAGRVAWLHGDVTTYPFPPRAYDVWHDRAVFHFLTQSAGRVAYVRQVTRSVAPGGHVIVATFGPQGPTQCSGLDVVRYDAEALHNEFGARFKLVDHATEVHRTPWGTSQQFVYCYCNLIDDAAPGEARR